MRWRNMPIERVNITREELYRRIWATPATKLAREFGISDVALGKICRKLNIPKPYPGYWAKVEAGASIKPSPLPRAKEDTPDSVTIYPTTLSDPFQEQNPEVQARIEAERLPDNRIHVSTDIEDAHPLVRQTQKLLEKPRKRPSDLRRIMSAHPHLDVSITQTLVRRALCIMDALVKALEARGHSVEVGKGDSRATRIVIGEEKVRVRLWEQDDRTSRVLTEEEKKKPPQLILNRWIYTPSGKLTFTINESWIGSHRKNWTDKERKPLEEQLNDVVIGILTAAEGLRKDKIEREEREQRWKEEAQWRRESDWRRTCFERLAGMWVKSQNLQAFLKASERFITERVGEGASIERTTEWLRWAHHYSEILDPFMNGDFEKMLRQVNEPFKSIS
jgi:hypothetical protein